MNAVMWPTIRPRLLAQLIRVAETLSRLLEYPSMPLTHPRRPFQFSLLTLMGLTAGVAVLSLLIRLGFGPAMLFVIAAVVVLILVGTISTLAMLGIGIVFIEATVSLYRLAISAAAKLRRHL
jgi:hypothetical protein